MAEFLSQDEIDALLDICDDEPEDLGSPEFEKLYEDFLETFKRSDDNIRNDGYCPPLNGANPGDIIESLEETEKYFQQTLENYKEFKKYKKEFKRLEETQPEIFI